MPSDSSGAKAKSTSRRSALRVPRAPEILAAKIKSQIVKGELKEGDFLPAESVMMEQYGVSRPTIRESYRILEAERLVSVACGARGGAVVHAPDPNLIASYMLLVLQAEKTTIDEVYQTLAILEPPLVGYIARNAWKTAPAVLQACLDAEHAGISSDLQEFAKATAGFHRALIELSGLHPLVHLIAALREVIEKHQTRVVALRHYGGTVDQIRKSVAAGLKSHKKLIEFIAARDPEGAELHWRRHWDVTFKIWVTDFEGKTIVELLHE